MSSGDQTPLGLGFGAVAAAYDRARPTYPVEAAAWLTGPPPRTVVEVGAGTGKLTDVLVAAGHDLLATDPDEDMLRLVRHRHPGLRTATAYAEEIPVATRSVDVVVAGQCFGWFDQTAMLREAARVLKTEGRVAIVHNARDERIPWVRRYSALVAGTAGDDGGAVAGGRTDPTQALVSSGMFGYVEEQTFRHWQPMRKADLLDLASSRSNIVALEPRARERVLGAVGELYDSYDRGPAGLLLPYLTHCYSATVKPRGRIEEPEHSADLTAAARSALLNTLQDPDERPGSTEDPGTPLIDFR